MSYGQIQENWYKKTITTDERFELIFSILESHPDIIKNKYLDLYKIIVRATYSDGKMEEHHIVPECLGGADLPCNRVMLPIRHHFVAHLCLVRCTRGRTKYLMNSSCHLFSKKRKGRVSSRLVESIRIIDAEFMGEKSRGKPKSEETRRKMSESSTGIKRHYTPDSMKQRIEKFQETYAERELTPWNAGKTMADNQNVRRLSAGKTKGRSFVSVEPDGTQYVIPNWMALYCKQRDMYVENVNSKLRQANVALYRNYTIRRYESFAEARDAFPNAIEWTPDIEPKIFEYDKSTAMTGKIRGPYKRLKPLTTAADDAALSIRVNRTGGGTD
jgi:hypothetical protein